MTCGIYMIQNKVNGKMYIGQAVNIEKRWVSHKSAIRGGYHRNKHLQNSWKRDGEDNFEFSILLECEESQLNTFEEYYIFELMTYDSRVGYNNSYGGASGRPTEEARRKISENHADISGEKNPNYGKGYKIRGEKNPFYGKHHSKEVKRKISEAKKGKTLSESTKRKMSESRKGEKNPNYGKGDTRRGEKNPNYGKHHTEEAKRKMSKPVVQIDMSTNKVVNTYFGAAEAGRQGGFIPSHIAGCCKGKLKTHKGYKWMYLSDYKNSSEQN